MGEGGCEDGLRHSCALLGSAPTHGRCSWLLVFKSAKFLFNSFPFQSPSLILFLIASDIPHPILQTCFMRLVSLSPDVPVFFGFSVACSRDDNPFVVWDAYSPPPQIPPPEKINFCFQEQVKQTYLFSYGVFALLLLYTPLTQFKSPLIQKTSTSLSSPAAAGGRRLMPRNPPEHRSLPSGSDVQQSMASLLCFAGAGRRLSWTALYLSFYIPRHPQVGNVKKEQQ